MLHVRRFGSGPAVVALHGFTLTGAQFATPAVHLDRTVVAPDLPGHGLSLNAPASIDSAVRAVSEIIRMIDTMPVLLGYSQGGRIALVTALEHPNLISRLVLISATPGIDDPSSRAKRARSDAELATRIRATSLDVFLDSWTTRGITSTTHVEPTDREADRLTRSQNTPSGLAAALEGMGQGVQTPVWERLHELSMPTMLMHGSEDTKYGAIASQMVRSIPRCEVVSIPGTGHNPLLESPEATCTAISDFLDGPR